MAGEPSVAVYEILTFIESEYDLLGDKYHTLQSLNQHGAFRQEDVSMAFAQYYTTKVRFCT